MCDWAMAVAECAAVLHRLSFCLMFLSFFLSYHRWMIDISAKVVLDDCESMKLAMPCWL